MTAFINPFSASFTFAFRTVYETFPLISFVYFHFSNSKRYNYEGHKNYLQRGNPY